MLNIVLNNSQQNAIGEIVRSLNPDAPVVLSGAAGTGKTVVLSKLREYADTEAEIYATPTHKARLVAKQKLGEGRQITTLHRLCKRPAVVCESLVTRLQGELDAAEKVGDRPAIVLLRSKLADLVRPSFVDREFITLEGGDEEEPDLVIVDEASMVGSDLANTLFRLCKQQEIPIVAFGDPNQLPPVKDNQFFYQPGYCQHVSSLNQVVRQAENSAIVWLAHQIIVGHNIQGIQAFQHDLVMWPQRVNLAAYDQIIVGTHRNRHLYNAHTRVAIGFHTERLCVGERLIARGTSYTLGVYNNETFEIVKILRKRAENHYVVDMRFPSGYIKHEVDIYMEEPEDKDSLIRSRKIRSLNIPVLPVDYAYAITCHSSQGSEWDKVLVIDDSRVFRQAARNWLYTAITRAKKHLTIMKG